MRSPRVTRIGGLRLRNTMTTKNSEERGALSPEIRRQALEILRSQGRRGLNDVEKILGWDGHMRVIQMAQQLGITKDQLRYMLFRNERQTEAKEKRIAEKEARNVEFATYTSSKLKFAISFPADWRVTTDTLRTESDGITLEQAYAAFQRMFPKSGMSLEDYRRKVDEREAPKEVSAEEAYQRLLEEERAKAVEFQKFTKTYERDRRQAYRLFVEKLLGTPPTEEIEALASRNLSATEAYDRLMANPETFLVSFPEFKEQYEQDLRQCWRHAENRASLAQMEWGLFQVSPSNSDEDEVSAEVTKLKLTNPMAALKLYELDKPPPEQVPTGTGSRPSKGMVVDGLHGVAYYFLFNTGETNEMREMPKFFNVYLAENDEGWIIACSCKAGTFNKYKPVFKRIIGSFRRIEIASSGV